MAKQKAKTPEWPATAVKLLPLREIIPFPDNPRTHPPAQIALLADLMKRYGVDQPIVVDEENVILKGHGRLLAAEAAGFETFPVVRHLGLDKNEKDAIRIADNQMGLLSGWDKEKLQATMVRLNSDGFDVPLLGFSELQLRGWDIFPGATGNDPEAAPELPKKPTTKLGDLWLLGDHRLLCGDCTKPADVARACGEAKPHLMVTDPPYGVDYDPNWRNEEAAKGRLAYAARRIGVVENDTQIDWSSAWKLFAGDVAYVWHADRHASRVQQSIEDIGLMVRAQIIWAKSNYPISRGHYHWRHEPCWYAVRAGATGHWQGARDQTTLWQINLDPNVEGGHSTQKPIECMKRPIENNSKAGDAVYDPFVGSGTTIIAAEMTKRRAIALEINPAYVDVCVKRWEVYTGRKAELVSAATPRRLRGKRSASAEPLHQDAPL